jgi:hypothetical protein
MKLQAFWHGPNREMPGEHQMTSQSENLRKAIENLIDAKLQDVLARPGGLDRLLAHRRTGVASPDIRNAEKRLELALAELVFDEAGQKAFEEEIRPATKRADRRLAV